ncbi:nucleotidyltransferase domain-containing protein [Halalkalicoccus tibetensis]|uniref:Nucleotidyltransferase domain-containing protein n=1 Tax=Halalkalicoccus tibetensis TaxID=175632 RepID=A0ABD5V419_9EURY
MYVELRLPLPDEQVFRYEAMDDVLEITATNPTTEFSNRDLQSLTGFGGPSVSKALSLLEAMGLLHRRDTSTKSLYRIDERRLHDPEDPFLAIPQAEFRTPLERFAERIRENVPMVVGIVCFGSVARGEADRASDLDVFVLVEEDDTLVSARRSIAEIKRDLESERIDGQRYEFEVFVESVESARRRGEDLLPILGGGVVLYETDAFRRVTAELFGGETA